MAGNMGLTGGGGDMGHQFKNVAIRNKIIGISRQLGSQIFKLSSETIATKNTVHVPFSNKSVPYYPHYFH